MAPVSSKPLHFQRQSSTHQANPWSLLPTSSKPHSGRNLWNQKLEIFFPWDVSPGLISEFPQEPYYCSGPVCGQSIVQEVSGVSLPSPTPLTTPHWGPLQQGLPQRQPCPTESGTAGNQPLSASGAAATLCEERPQIQPGATARTRSL